MASDNVKVTLQPIATGGPPGDVAVEVTLTNTGAAPEELDLSHAHIPSLSLEIRDANGNPVPMPPPPVPKAEDLRLATLAPGQSHRIRMHVPFDAHHSGEFQLRFRHRRPAVRRPGVATEVLSATSATDTLTSEWTRVAVSRGPAFRATAEVARLEPIALQPSWSDRFLCLLRCLRFVKRPCDKVASTEVDSAITEVMTHDPRGDGTYSWHSRFLLSLDQPHCRITVTVRIRLTGAITAAQQTAWKNAIEAKWSNTFKLCCREGCCRGCCANGYSIAVDVQFVTTGEHQVVAVGPQTLDMGNWSAADTVDVTHEFGHMLGNPDEYFTVNGTDYGPGRQANGNIMNNPANQPIARHFDLIRTQAQALIGAGVTCTVKGATESC